MRYGREEGVVEQFTSYIISKAAITNINKFISQIYKPKSMNSALSMFCFGLIYFII